MSDAVTPEPMPERWLADVAFLAGAWQQSGYAPLGACMLIQALVAEVRRLNAGPDRAYVLVNYGVPVGIVPSLDAAESYARERSLMSAAVYECRPEGA